MKTIVKSKKVIKNDDEMNVKTPLDNIKKTLDKVLNVDEDMDEFFDFSDDEHKNVITKTKNKIVPEMSSTNTEIKNPVNKVDIISKQNTGKEFDPTFSGTELITVNIKDLEIHPEYFNIYDEDDINVDNLVESMKDEKQSLNPPIVNQDLKIISGIRRYKGYMILNVKVIQVIKKKINPEDIPLTIINSNIQRTKKCVEVINEYDTLMKYYSHQGRRTSDSNETEGETLTRNKVCKMIGYSYSNIGKLKKIKENQPELLHLIDVGKKTIHKCSQICDRKTHKTEKVLDENQLSVKKSNLFRVETMKDELKMNDNTVQCIVTTPPKFEGGKSVSTYIDSLLDRLLDCQRVMTKDGSMYLIVNDVRKESGEMNNIPELLMSRLLKLGFYHIDTIIWEYSTPPTISGKYLVPSFKYIYHLTKSLNYYKNEVGINIRKNVLPSNPNGNSKTEIYDKYRFYKNREWNKEWISENIIRTPRTELIENSKPSSIVETLPIGLILDSTKEGDIVLNPYNTDESVGFVSLFYDRSFVGFTDNDETTEIQQKRFERFVIEYQKVG